MKDAPIRAKRMSGLLGYFPLAGSARASNSSFNESRVFGALESDRRPELADGLDGAGTSRETAD
jgi:hypothetical protein